MPLGWKGCGGAGIGGSFGPHQSLWHGCCFEVLGNEVMKLSGESAGSLGPDVGITTHLVYNLLQVTLTLSGNKSHSSPMIKEQQLQNQAELGSNLNYILCDLRQVSSPLWDSISSSAKWASSSSSLSSPYHDEAEMMHEKVLSISMANGQIPLLLLTRAVVRIKRDHACKSTLRSTKC